MSLVYSKEKSLFRICAAISVLFWVVLIAGTLGVALFFLALSGIGYLFAQSALISYLRGNGVRVGADQLPELYARFQGCCRTLGHQPE